MNFGFRKKREKKEKSELFPDKAVLTIYPTPTKGKGYKFELNSKAIELLDVTLGESTIGLSQSEGIIKVANTTELNVPGRARVTKQSTFSDAFSHKYLVSHNLIDGNKTNHFELTIDVVKTIQDKQITIFNAVLIETEQSQTFINH